MGNLHKMADNDDKILKIGGALLLGWFLYLLLKIRGRFIAVRDAIIL